MDESIYLDLDYRENEVIAAQHMRFLRSSRVIVLGIAGIIGTIYLATQQFNLWKIEGNIPSGWYTPIFLPAIFLAACLFAYFVAPLIDFRQNSFWKYTYQLKLLPDQLYLSMKNAKSGIKYEWKDAKRVLESKEMYVVFYSSESHFLMIPKRVLGEKEPYFRERLNQAKFIVEKNSS